MSDERIVPWWERLPHILGYPAHARGFLAAIFLGVVSWMGSMAGIGPMSILFKFGALGVIFTTMFLIIRS